MISGKEDNMSRTIRAAAAVLAAVFVITLVTALSLNISTRAETSGTAPAVLIDKGTRKISKTFTISSDSVIPEGAVLYVRNGGRLYIKSGAELILNGMLKIASGGSVFVQGDVSCGEGSLISATGKIKILKAGTVSLGGTMKVNKGGNVCGLGTLKVLNNFSDISCKGTVTAKIKAPAPVETNGVTTVGGVIIVNREFDLPKDYGSGLDESTYDAYLKMKKASGYDMSIVSGFRSYEKQKATFAYWESIDGFERADRYSAQPGHSEHQTGLAMDISSLKQSYGETDEGKWLAANCWKYGFLLRYPKNSEHITGYIYEPWHVRYLGTSTAKLVHDSGLTLEEFLGVY